MNGGAQKKDRMNKLILGLVLAFMAAAAAATVVVMFVSKQGNDELAGDLAEAFDNLTVETDTDNPYTDPRHYSEPPMKNHIVYFDHHHIDLSSNTGTLTSTRCRVSSSNVTHLFSVFLSGSTSYASVHQRQDDFDTWRHIVWNQSLGSNVIADMTSDALTIVHADTSSNTIDWDTYNTPDDTATSGTLTTSSSIASPTGASNMESLVCDDSYNDRLLCLLTTGDLYEYNGAWSLVDDDCSTFQQCGDWMAVTSSTSVKFYRRVSDVWTEQIPREVTDYTSVQNAWVAHDGAYCLIENLNSTSMSYDKMVFKWNSSSTEWTLSHMHPQPVQGDWLAIKASVFPEGDSVVWATKNNATYFEWGHIKYDHVDSMDEYGDTYELSTTVDTLESGAKYFVVAIYSTGRLTIYTRKVVL